MPTYYVPGKYENPLTADGRARTIAAFHLAQGNVDNLSDAEMRGDVLSKLMSPTAIGWWLKKNWLVVSRKIGRVRLLRLTSLGLQTCSNSLSGLADTNTTASLVLDKRHIMSLGGPNHTRTEFAELPVST